MAGGDLSAQGNRYTHNDAAFAEYNTRLQSNNLSTFTSAASKFTEWLGSDKAYYPNARVSVRLSSRPLTCTPLIIESRLDCLRCRGMPVKRPFSLQFLTTLRDRVCTCQYLSHSRGSICTFHTGRIFARSRPLVSVILVTPQASREPPESFRT